MNYSHFAEPCNKQLQKINSKEQLNFKLKTDSKRLIDIQMKIELDYYKTNYCNCCKSVDISYDKGYKSYFSNNGDNTTITTDYKSNISNEKVRKVKEKYYARFIKNLK